MHIAICDDNIADRKHLERLLGRESDKRASLTGVFYIDSFGKADNLLDIPLQYDLFFLDMPGEKDLTCSIVESLINQGVTAPIILCSSKIDYTQFSFSEQVLHLCKPITPAKLDSILEHAISIKQNAPALVELRIDKETLYIPPDKILYASPQGHYVNVVLSDKTVTITSTIENFYSNVSGFSEIVPISNTVVINVHNIARIDGLFIYMKNGRRFLVSPAALYRVKSIYQPKSSQ